MNSSTSCARCNGLKIGAEALYDEFNLPQPLNEQDVLPGEAQPVTKGGKLVGGVEAANEGAAAPDAASPAPESITPTGEPAVARAASRVTLAPTDIASIVTVDEARVSQGLPLIGGEDGKLTVIEYKAKHASTVSAAAAAAAGKKDEPEPTGSPAGRPEPEDERTP